MLSWGNAMVNERGPIMAPVIELATDDLLARRAELLSSVGLESYAQFRERSNRDVLSAREWSIRDELDSVEYLLGEDDLTD